jgi:hypothetical protein
MCGTRFPKLKKVTNIELHKTLLVFDKQRHERKEIGALEVNGARKSHQRMDPMQDFGFHAYDHYTR